MGGKGGKGKNKSSSRSSSKSHEGGKSSRNSSKGSKREISQPTKGKKKTTKKEAPKEEEENLLKYLKDEFNIKKEEDGTLLLNMEMCSTLKNTKEQYEQFNLEGEKVTQASYRNARSSLSFLSSLLPK